MVEAKLKNGKTCLYCNTNNNGRLNEEGVCRKCENLNDEELSGYGECQFCEDEVRRGNLRELNGEMGCPECVRTCHGCGNHYNHDDGSSCEFCDDEFCEDCVGSCEICNSNICSECKIKCAKCGNMVCPDCVVKRKGKVYCTNCEEEMNGKQEKLIKACA